MTGRAEALERVVRVYDGSNGDATKAMYAELEALGSMGAVAMNLFRAQKNSSRAKVYRGRGYRGAAYTRKQWSIDNLVSILIELAERSELDWGWGTDPEQPMHNVVLYVDLPTGQVSFHSDKRGEGPDYPGHWDGMRGQSPDRICRWCARLLASTEQGSLV